MWAKVWKVKVVHRVSAIKIYNSFDRSAVKTNRRLFGSCSHNKACNFPSFINIFSETVLDKLSPLNIVHNYGDQWECAAFKILSSRLKSLHVYVAYPEKKWYSLVWLFLFLFFSTKGHLCSTLSLDTRLGMNTYRAWRKMVLGAIMWFCLLQQITFKLPSVLSAVLTMR